MKKLITIILLQLAFLSSPFAQPKFNDSKLAHEYYRNKEYSKAVIFFEELYNSTKSKSYLTFYLNCLWELEKYDEAEKVLKKEIRKNPNDASLHVELGTSYKKQGDEEKANAKFESAIKKLQPKTNDVYHLANAYTRIREYVYAEKTYLEGRKLLKNNNLFRNQLANIYMYQRKHDLMINEYLFWMLERPDNIKHVKNRLNSMLMIDVEDNMYQMIKTEIIKRIQKSPDIDSYSELLIWLYVQKKEFRKAYIQSKALDIKRNERGTEIYKLANLAVNNKSYELAKEIYGFVMKYGPESSVYYLARKNYLNSSYLLLKENRDFSSEQLGLLEKEYEAAMSEFGSYPQSASIMLDFAHLKAFYLHDTDGAIVILDRIIAMSNVEPELYGLSKLELADIQLMNGDIWEAALLYGQVEKANESNPIGHEAKFRKAKLYYYSGNFHWAQALLDVLKASTSKLIANNAFELADLINSNTALDTSESAMKLFAKADMLNYQRQTSISLLTYDSIISLFPGHSLADEVYLRKGDIHFSEKDYSNALICYETITSNFPNETLGDNALFKLASLHESQLGNSETALELYQKLLTDYPSSIFVAESRKRFRILRGDDPTLPETQNIDNLEIN